MLIVVPVVVGLVVAVLLRQTAGATRDTRRAVLIVTALALGIRIGASLVIYFIARRTHGEGLWLNDEASFWLATESLLPNPFDKALPLGLDHLGGDGYLGLTTLVAMLFGGVADSNAFRFLNAG